jgi:signal transduction histidine kinase
VGKMVLSNTFASMAFTICGLFYILFIILMYVNKRQLNLKQNKTFIFLLLSTVLSLFSEAFYIIIMGMIDKGSFSTLTQIACRMYLYITDIWMLTFIYYIITLGLNNIDEEKSKKIKRTILIILIIIFFVICVISSMLSIGYAISKSGFYSFGGSASILNYIMGITLVVITIIVITFSKLGIPSGHKKPIYFSILYFLLTTLFEVLTGYDFNILTFQFVFMTATLYFTIESQDNKLIAYLEESNKKAEIANKEKNEFLSNMSHEIRSPMYTILGFNELLLDEPVLTPELVRRDTEHVYNAGVKLLDLINNIIDISKLESGKVQKEEKDYKLKDIILDVNTNINSLVNKNQIEFSINVNPEIPNNYLGDGEKLSKIINNVLKNSIKYTGIGKISLDINGTMEPNNEFKFEIVVSNTGHEMKEEDFNIQFNDYVKINNTSMNNIDSTLLGLIISKELASIIDMDFKFQNEKGKGTKYFLFVTQKVTDNTPIGNVDELLKSINNPAYTTNQRMEVTE